MSQTITFEGSYNVGVQVGGDGNVVNVGLPYLVLAQRHRVRREPREPLDLLDPEFRAVPLIGRDKERRDLLGWLTGAAPIALRCLIGRAGSGKTRLTLELCEEAEARGWLAGFAASREVGRFLTQQNLAGWGWGKPTLVVVNYAAASARELRDWLAELADNPGDPARPLRLLLLERHADAQLGWWPEVIGGGGGFGGRKVRRLLDPSEPVPLPRIADVEERRAMLAEVMARASALAGRAEPLRPPPPGERADFDARLANPSWEFEPLYLLMAGLVAVHHGIGNLLAWSRTDLAVELAERELERIARLAGGNRSRELLLRHMAACVTLTGGCPRDGVEPVVAEERDAVDLHAAGDPPVIAERLHDGMSAEGVDGLAAIRPDLIGEAAVLAMLGPRSMEQQRAIVGRAYDRAPQAAVATVIRTAQDYATGREHPALAWLDHLVHRSGDDLGALWSIAAQLPEDTTNLREQAAGITSAIVDKLRSKLTDRVTEEHQSLLAGCLNNLAVQLSALGRRAAALGAIEETVAVYRALAASRSETFQPDLAVSLINLAKSLMELGRPDDALAAAQEAVTRCRKLAASRPDAFRRYLGKALNSLAVVLGELGRREEALAAANEAVGVYRELTASRHEAVRGDLAGFLMTLAQALNALERFSAQLAGRA